MRTGNPFLRRPRHGREDVNGLEIGYAVAVVLAILLLLAAYEGRQ